MDAESEQIENLKAEIARLKGRNARLEKWNLMTDEQVVMDLKAEIEKRDKLITELCDALEWWEKQGDYQPKFAATLIQRAREAARCQ